MYSSPRFNGPRTILFGLLIALLVGCAVRGEVNAPIAQEVLLNQIDSGTAPLILDVRSTEEYAAGHIPGAINIDFREISSRLDEISVDRDSPIIVYCERGVRAGIAERTLEDAGFTAILLLEGDILRWRRQGLPLVEATQQELKAFELAK